jgi:DNA-binding transcriptional regulator YdaS (Cro superfamily)
MKTRRIAIGLIGFASLYATVTFAGEDSSKIQPQRVTEGRLTPEQLRQAKVAEIKGYRFARASDAAARGDRSEVQQQSATETRLTPEQLRQAKVAEIKGYRFARGRMEQTAEADAISFAQ